MLADSRPKVSVSLTNVQAASARLVPLLDNLKTTMNQANVALSHIDAVVVENRQDIRTIVVELKGTLLTASSLMEELQNTDGHQYRQYRSDHREYSRNHRKLETTDRVAEGPPFTSSFVGTMLRIESPAKK